MVLRLSRFITCAPRENMITPFSTLKAGRSFIRADSHLMKGNRLQGILSQITIHVLSMLWKDSARWSISALFLWDNELLLLLFTMYFLQDVRAYLDEHPQNVVGIHCKVLVYQLLFIMIVIGWERSNRHTDCRLLRLRAPCEYIILYWLYIFSLSFQYLNHSM